MLPLGESRIELLQRRRKRILTIGRFVARRGEGLHHVAVHVAEIDAMFARLTAQGVKLASDAVRVGAGGPPVFFCASREYGWGVAGDCFTAASKLAEDSDCQG